MVERGPEKAGVASSILALGTLNSRLDYSPLDFCPRSSAGRAAVS